MVKPEETILTQEEAVKIHGSYERHDKSLPLEWWELAIQAAKKSWWEGIQRVLALQARKTARMVLEDYESRAQRFLLTDEEIVEIIRSRGGKLSETNSRETWESGT